MHRSPFLIALLCLTSLSACSDESPPAAPDAVSPLTDTPPLRPPPPLPEGATTLPDGHPPIGGMPAGHPPMDGGGAKAPHGGMGPGMGGHGTRSDPGFTWTAPDDWSSSPPTNNMRVAQFAVDGVECVIYGNSIGGTTQENLDRWIAQFSQPDGSPSKEAAEVTSSEKGGVTLTRLELTGTYSNSFMGGESGDDAGASRTAILAAVAETATGRVFVKMVGPVDTVMAAEAGFDALLGSITPKE